MHRLRPVRPRASALALLLAFSVFGVAACADDGAAGKDAIRTQIASGKGDFGGDVCQQNGWYGDGVCDDFCPEYDAADCGGSCPEGVSRAYCLVAAPLACPAGEHAIVDPDGCGCGCVPDDDAPTCPDPSRVTAHSCFTLDAWECAAGETQLVDPDGCGCGCVRPEAPATECRSDAECGDGRSCAPGPFCYAWCAAGDPACCEGNTCVDVPTEQQPCETDAACAPGEYCPPAVCYFWCEANDPSCCGERYCEPRP